MTKYIGVLIALVIVIAFHRTFAVVIRYQNENELLTSHSFALSFAIGLSITLVLLISLAPLFGNNISLVDIYDLLIFVPLINLIIGYPIARLIYKYVIRQHIEKNTR